MRYVPVSEEVYEVLRVLREATGTSWSELIKGFLEGTLVLRLRGLRTPELGAAVAYRRYSGRDTEIRLYLGKVPLPPPCGPYPCYSLRASYRGHRVLVTVARSGDSLALYRAVYATTGLPDPEVARALVALCLRRAAKLYRLPEDCRVVALDREVELLLVGLAEGEPQP